VSDSTIPDDSTSGFSGSKVLWKYRTPFITAQTAGIDKILKDVYVVADALAGSIKITPVIDGDSLTALEKSIGTGAPAVKTVSYPFPSSAIGREVALQIEPDTATANQNAAVRQVELWIDRIGKGRP
jgi:hypothetical protein